MLETEADRVGFVFVDDFSFGIASSSDYRIMLRLLCPLPWNRAYTYELFRDCLTRVLGLTTPTYGNLGHVMLRLDIVSMLSSPYSERSQESRLTS